MKLLAVILLAWLAAGYLDTGASAPVSVSVKPAIPPALEDCHCLIEPNRGLYR